MQLPDINGLDLQQQLARDGGGPPIFISGHGDIPLAVRAMKGGAIEFLPKPIETEALLAFVREAFTWAAGQALVPLTWNFVPLRREIH